MAEPTVRRAGRGTVVGMHDAELDVARSSLRWSGEAPRARRDRRRVEAPVRALQVAALSDPDPFRRAGYLALLEADPFDSDGHRRLISALDRAGQHGAARHARERYSDHMRELGITDA